MPASCRRFFGGSRGRNPLPSFLNCSLVRFSFLPSFPFSLWNAFSLGPLACALRVKVSPEFPNYGRSMPSSGATLPATARAFFFPSEDRYLFLPPLFFSLRPASTSTDEGMVSVSKGQQWSLFFFPADRPLFPLTPSRVSNLLPSPLLCSGRFKRGNLPVPGHTGHPRSVPPPGLLRISRGLFALHPHPLPLTLLTRLAMRDTASWWLFQSGFFPRMPFF